MTSSVPEFTEHVVTGSPVKDLILDGTKVGWYADRIHAWERGERIAPVTIDAAWTRKCQAACDFCYASMQASEGGEITRDIAFRFLDDCAEIGVKGVSLISDGESTVVPFYADSIVYGAEKGIQIGIGTNGVVLKRRILEKILPSLTYLRFNFSGGTRERYADIMGLKPHHFDIVVQNVRDAMEIKRRLGLKLSINLQMVVMGRHADQILPVARLAKELGVDYCIFKHTADDVQGHLGIDYKDYPKMYDDFHEAESLSEGDFRVAVKWARIENEGKREYSRCYGPPFIMQLSGNGLIAPCGFLFNERYKKFHAGNICSERFRDIFASDRYWEIMDYLASDEFDPRKRCGPNCLQDRTNDFLFRYKAGQVQLPTGQHPPDMGFL